MFSENFKKISFYILPSILSAIFPIVTLPIYTRSLSVREYGIYALCIAFATFASGLSNMGLTAGYERNFFEQKNSVQHGKLLFSVVFFVLFIYLFIGILIYLFKNILSTWIIGNSYYGESLFFAYLAISISSLKSYFLLYYRNIGNAKSHAWFSIDEIILNVLISILLVLYFKMRVNGLIIGQLLGSTIVMILLLSRFRKILPIGFSSIMLKKCFSISLPLTPKIFFGVIGTQFDKYMISLLNSLGSVGLYNLGQKIANVVFNFMTALQNVLSPVVYKFMFDNGNDKEGYIGKYLTFPYFVSALVGLCLSIFSEELVRLLTPVEYHEAGDVVSALSLMYVIYFFSKQPQLIYAKKTGTSSWLSLLGIFLNLAINVPFILNWGGLGAAYGSLLSAVISVAISLFVSQKFFYIKWEWTKIIYITTILFLFSLINILMRYLHINFSLIFFIKFIMIITYIIGAYLFKIFTKEHLKLLSESISIFKKNYFSKIHYKI